MNRCIHDEHIGKHIKHEAFNYNDNKYCKNTDLITNNEWYTKQVDKKWVEVPTTIDLELAYDTRKSRRLW